MRYDLVETWEQGEERKMSPLVLTSGEEEDGIVGKSGRKRRWRPASMASRVEAPEASELGRHKVESRRENLVKLQVLASCSNRHQSATNRALTHGGSYRSGDLHADSKFRDTARPREAPGDRNFLPSASGRRESEHKAR